MGNDATTCGDYLRKHGRPIYRSNPSVANTKTPGVRKRRIGNDQRGVVLDGSTGEILGDGGAMFYELEEVDEERFVKLYITGLKKAVGLSKAGLSLFEIVYHQLRNKPNCDDVELSYLDTEHGMKKTTFFRALGELLDRQILYRSIYPGKFYVDITVMFNGDRLAFVKGYHLGGGKKKQIKPPHKQVDDPQGTLPL